MQNTNFTLKLIANRLQYDPELTALEARAFQKAGIAPEAMQALKNTSHLRRDRPASFSYVYTMLKSGGTISDYSGLIQFLQRCYCPNYSQFFVGGSAGARKEFGTTDLPDLSYVELWKLLLVRARLCIKSHALHLLHIQLHFPVADQTRVLVPVCAP